MIQDNGRYVSLKSASVTAGISERLEIGIESAVGIRHPKIRFRSRRRTLEAKPFKKYLEALEIM